MDIGNILSQSQSQQLNDTKSGNAGNASLGKDDFLKLLVTQMRNQDPINPMDGKEFAAQLAQFNSVEQLINVNKGIESLAQSQQDLNSGLNNSMAASLAGKEVKALSNQISLKDGNAVIDFRLKHASTETQVIITDSMGNIVRSDQLGSFSNGDQSWVWDGTSDHGEEVPDGIYSIEVNAQNENGDVESITFTRGIAESVKYTENGVKLLVNGAYIPIGDIEEIGY